MTNMKPIAHTLKRATGDTAASGTEAITNAISGFDLSTIVNGVTNTVGHITNTIVNGLQITERTKQLRDYFKLKDNENNRDFLQNLAWGGQTGDAGFIIVVLLVILGLGGGLFLIVKHKKQ